jgi:S1-C subfamily serine protease
MDVQHLRVWDSGSVVLAASDAEVSQSWQVTIDRVINCVVSIRFRRPHPFDTESASCSQATGFVVDAKEGYILTNRHVVGDGPFDGHCIFKNDEKCDVYPFYRDPVHDFGVLKFDPKSIKHMPVFALTLRPDLAKVGVEIRIVGNDGGEKLSILSGVISRVDRNAPEYGKGYTDFNTNYIQTATAGSGGSSGSPVVDRDGFVVALKAGGRVDRATTDYLLPLDRPLRALQLIQKDKPVSRGTIQTQWLLESFEECRRRGLSVDTEEDVRMQFPNNTGMLVAKVVLPQGPASNTIESGDIMIKINHKLVTKFVDLDSVLDDHVGKTVTMTIQRATWIIDVELDVGNLYHITPARFVSVAGASFNDLSYQVARRYSMSLKNAGVYVCKAAGSFWGPNIITGWLILKVNHEPTPTLDKFIEVIKGIPDSMRIPVQCKNLDDPHNLSTTYIDMDRHWFPHIQIATRDDTNGQWCSKIIRDRIPAAPQQPKAAKFPQVTSKYAKAMDNFKSLVKVEASMPVQGDGFFDSHKLGYGLVLDAEDGFVIVSGTILTHEPCDISLTFADSITINATWTFAHPYQNYVIVRYNTSLVNAPVKTPKLATEFIKKGEKTLLVGVRWDGSLDPVISEAVVSNISTMSIPASRHPRYHAMNFNAIDIDSTQSYMCDTGVLCAEDGTVQAFWLTFLGKEDENSPQYIYGLATPSLLPILQEIRGGKIPKLRILNIEFGAITINVAHFMGVSHTWTDEVDTTNPERPRLLMVRKADFRHGMQEGDILCTLNDRLITQSSDLDIMYSNEILKAVFIREGKQMESQISTIPTEGLETDRLVSFCGAVFQSPHFAAQQRIRKVYSEVYISSISIGSPAHMSEVSGHRLYPLRDVLTWLAP